ncbi:MAG: UDP-N-acetylmuramate--L-alanine ligase [Chloroflexi bacterium]|nr:UDP-N-acetylmuramate--L-alanine ligase [Chloroflexota bacterium]
MNLTPDLRLHIVGIGGTGMSAIARVLLERGYTLTGSDRSPGPLADALARDGVKVTIGHDAANIAGADALLITSAARDNPEVEAALRAGIPVYKRRDFLPALLDGLDVLAIAGTHGKTTSTAMTTHILREAGLEPGYIVGSVMANTGTNAAVGAGQHFVIEADEYDHMYHGLSPAVAVITSAEWDHPDFFPTEADMTASFATFIGKIAPNGILVVNGDDPRTLALAAHHTGRTFTYGLNADNHVRISEPTIGADAMMAFDITSQAGWSAHLRLAQWGKHNAANATAALLAAHYGADISPQIASRALESFQSTGRRFEVRGEAGGLTVIDDYAHHPTAIRVTLEAARMRYPGRRVWAVWQPHTFSRTAALLDDYARAFSDADEVLVTDIYAAREAAVSGVDGQSAAAAIGAHHPNTRHSGSIDDTADLLIEQTRPGDVVILMSAGDAPRIGELLLSARR